MGNWTLERVAHRTQIHDTAELFGNHYMVTLTLRYKPSTFDSFVETPKLDWNEVIMMNEHHKGEHWVFHTNMYEHNPLSKTLEIWAKRYVAAYNRAAGLPDPMTKGSSQLVDKNGQAVALDKLGRGIADAKAKADAVRSYLKKHGGMLIIEVDDIPSINIPKGGEHKERLLIFNCGVVGGGMRTQAIQHLDVNAAQPKTNWTRRFDLSHTLTGLKTSALKTVPPPSVVSLPRTPVFAAGECW